MPEVPTADWSPQQRRLLQAMGLPVWRQVASAQVGPGRETHDLSCRLRLRSRAGDELTLGLSGDDTLPTDPTQGLFGALLRAVGIQGAHIEVLSVKGVVDARLPPLAELAASANARRALWPSLRRLRREALGSPQ